MKRFLYSQMPTYTVPGSLLAAAFFTVIWALADPTFSTKHEGWAQVLAMIVPPIVSISLMVVCSAALTDGDPLTTGGFLAALFVGVVVSVTAGKWALLQPVFMFSAPVLSALAHWYERRKQGKQEIVESNTTE